MADGWTLVALANVLHSARCRRPHDWDGGPGKDGKGCGFWGDGKLEKPNPNVGAAHRELWLKHAEEVLAACNGEARGVIEGLAVAYEQGQYRDKTYPYTAEETKRYDDAHLKAALSHIKKTLQPKKKSA